MYYENPDFISDDICCELLYLDLFSGAVGGWTGLCGEAPGDNQFALLPVFAPVDNNTSAYTARCQQVDFGAVTSDVQLWGYVVEYTYTEMGR